MTEIIIEKYLKSINERLTIIENKIDKIDSKLHNEVIKEWGD